jgi:hypothetical protein
VEVSGGANGWSKRMLVKQRGGRIPFWFCAVFFGKRCESPISSALFAGEHGMWAEKVQLKVIGWMARWTPTLSLGITISSS